MAMWVLICFKEATCSSWLIYIMSREEHDFKFSVILKSLLDDVPMMTKMVKTHLIEHGSIATSFLHGSFCQWLFFFLLEL